jgi:hypothetical protein
VPGRVEPVLAATIGAVHQRDAAPVTARAPLGQLV